MKEVIVSNTPPGLPVDPTSAAYPPAPPAAPQYQQQAQPVQPGYVQPQYQPPAYAQSGYSQVGAKTNTFAIVGLITSFFLQVVGLILSIIALGQIKRTGEGGRSLAIAGIIISSVGIVVGIIVAIIYIVIFAAYGSSLAHYYSTY